MRGRPQLPLIVGAIGVLVVLAVVALIIVPRLVSDTSNQDEQDEAKTFPTEATPPAGPTAQAAVKGVPGGPFPTPIEEVYKGCPAGGDGTDPELNTLKNRIDQPKNPVVVAFNSILQLPWPASVSKKHMVAWSAADRTEVARHNGAGVTVEGYFIRVQQEGAESPNCHATDPTDVDYHEWITLNAGDDRTKAVVVEATPRLRAKNAGWTLANFQKLARDKARVRITGWLMLDPEHPDQIGNTRGTIWEIHPITKVEVFQNNSWVDFNNLK